MLIKEGDELQDVITQSYETEEEERAARMKAYWSRHFDNSSQTLANWKALDTDLEQTRIVCAYPGTRARKGFE